MSVLWRRASSAGFLCSRMAADHKRLPLTTAFANKAVTVVWGIIWGALFFKEPVTIGKIAGAVLVILGVVLYAYADKEAGGK